MEKMRFNKENTMNRVMNNGRIKNYYLPGIHSPGTDEDCRNQPMGHTMQTQVQLTEQTFVSGCFRSRIPEHDPIKGDAG
jgi:hypothetical protein